MAYVISKALAQLRGELFALSKVASKSSAIHVGGKHKPIIQNSLLSSTLLLGFAHFEEYVRSLVEDVCKQAAMNFILVEKLPIYTRMHVSIAANLKAWSQIQDPTKLLETLATHHSNGDFAYMDAHSSVHAGLSSLLLSGVTYPKPENLRKLFRRFGIKNVFADMNRIAESNTEQLLTSFHDARATLAHEGVPPGWAPSDFVDKLAQLRLVASSLDRAFSIWTTSFLGTSCWSRNGKTVKGAKA